ncbi:MAG: alcohol dehydrogenase catalytic domain-containing protein [Myxococcales bacterium]|nr:alcohol dehydrogenase catalytic domain-containing protein [Myxococcales bacterium]
MRAAVTLGGAALGVEDRPIPEPGPGEVRVRVRACGICGTDLHYQHDGLWKPGHTPGHEMAGVLDALGEGAQGVKVGATVAVEPLRPCGTCRYCREGRAQICPDLKLYGIHLPGGLAEYMTVPAERVYPVPADLSPALAALAEPVAVVVHGLRRGGFAPGDRVLVIGAGSIGLLTTLAARALGAGEILVTARHPRQGELAKALGATEVLGEAEATRKALDALGRARAIDLVVETVGGHADTLRLASAAVRPGGTVSVLGVFMEKVALDPLPLLLKETTLAWSNCYRQHHGKSRADFADAIDLIAGNREALSLVATHQVPLERVSEAFEIAGNKAAGAVKVTVTAG